MKFGKRHAVEQAYLDHSDEIFRFLYWQAGDTDLAEDLTSEVFIRAWNHTEIFENAEHNARAWLYTVARNLLKDHWRKKQAVALDDIPEPLSDQDVVGDAIVNEEHTQIHAAIATLDERMQTVVILRFLQHLPVRSVAGIMQISEANVRTIQFRALKELKKRLS